MIDDKEFCATLDKMMEGMENAPNRTISYAIAKQIAELGMPRALVVMTMAAGYLNRMVSPTPEKFEEISSLMGILIKMAPPLDEIEKDSHKPN